MRNLFHSGRVFSRSYPVATSSLKGSTSIQNSLAEKSTSWKLAAMSSPTTAASTLAELPGDVLSDARPNKAPDCVKTPLSGL